MWCNVLPEHQIALIASDRLVLLLLLLLLSRPQEFQRLCVSEGVTRRILNSRPVPRRHGGRPAAAGRWQGELRLAGAPTHTHTKHTHTHIHPHTQTGTVIQQEDMALINSDCGATRSLRYQTALITSESQDGNAWGAKSDRA